MRLLHRLQHGSIELEEFHGDNIPPYAILSHTWENGEVTFDDFTAAKSSRPLEKQGWRKIESFCTQASSDNLDYAWIDTCCINKSSSSELAEAINSMYAWYQKAAVCYAYLSDEDSQHFTAMTYRMKPRWFTRGWTLQELIAPKEVIFFSRSWQRIGDKRTCTTELSEVTGIDETVLAGRDPHEVSVAQRMSWASQRVTTRVEDIAYCLMGLFDVNMPLLYGEGEKAFIRLQEEIAKQSDDQSLFAWDDSKSPNRQRLTGLLAASPSQFKECGDIFSTSSVGFEEEYSMTNRGLKIQLPMKQSHPENDLLYTAALSCYRKGKVNGLVVISLEHLVGNRYARVVWAPPKVNDLQSAVTWPKKSIFVPQKNFTGGSRESHDAIVVQLKVQHPRRKPIGAFRHFRLEAVVPSGSWNGISVTLPADSLQHQVVAFVFRRNNEVIFVCIDRIHVANNYLAWDAGVQHFKYLNGDIDAYIKHWRDQSSWPENDDSDLQGLAKNTRLKMHSQSEQSNLITRLLSIHFNNTHSDSIGYPLDQGWGEFVHVSFNGKEYVKGITVGVTFHDEELSRENYYD